MYVQQYIMIMIPEREIARRQPDRLPSMDDSATSTSTIDVESRYLFF